MTHGTHSRPVSDLPESEIFDCLVTNFREAAEHCEGLALQQNRVQGQHYVKLRDNLMKIEGAARQAAMWRDDSRWLLIGQHAAECHKKCGDWLRFKTRGRMFEKCAENMRMMLAAAQQMKDRATGIRGAILPEMPKYDPVNRSVQVRTPGGLLLPAGAVLQ